MIDIDFSTFINGVGSDLKTSVDDIINIIIDLQRDVAELKFKTMDEEKDTLSREGRFKQSSENN